MEHKSDLNLNLNSLFYNELYKLNEFLTNDESTRAVRERKVLKIFF